MPTRTRPHRGAVLALAAIMLAVSLALWREAVDVLLWTQDEEYFVQLARLLTEHFPSAVWDLPLNAWDERGPQRLTILLLAWPMAVVNGELGVEIARFLQCLAWSSAAIPAYLLARGAGLTRPWAVGAGAATIVVPWAVLSGTFLTEPVAYPMTLWAVWGAWRACVRPGWRSDVLAIALALLAVVARTQLVVLVVLAPAAIVLHTLIGAGWRPGQAARRLWREHPLYSALIVPGAILVLLNLVGIRPGPLQAASGTYVTSFDVADFSTLPPKWALQFSRIVIGVGVLPAILGLPWIIRQLVRRTSPEAGAMAATCLLGFVLVLLSTMYAAAEERYLMLVAPLLLLPGIVAIARGELPAWAVGLSALAVTVLVALVAWPYTEDQSRMLTDPVQAIWSRLVVRRAPGLGGEAEIGAALLILAAGALAVAATVLRRRVVLVPLALALLVGAVQLTQTTYIVHKRTALTAGKGGLADRTWIDDRVDEDVAILATGIGNGADYAPIWRDTTLWNRRVELLISTATLTQQIPRYGRATEVRVDPRSGRLVPMDGRRLPTWLVQPTGFLDLGLVGRRVATSRYLPLELTRIEGQPRAAWMWEGTEPDGFLSTNRRVGTLKPLGPAFDDGGPRVCAKVTLVAPANGGTHRYIASGGGTRRTGTLRAGDQADLTFRLRRGQSLRVRGTNYRDIGDGRKLTLILARTAVAPCGAQPTS